MDSQPEKNDLSARVRRTLEDLASIRQSLLSISGLPENPSQPSDQVLDLELAGELKSVVDALRLLLWAYIKALSAKSGRSPAEVLSWYKMQLAVEMLRSARSGGAPEKDPKVTEFERLVDSALSVAAKVPIIDHVH